jgi:Aminoglycoside-2''-adenylyltransferase
VHTFDDTTTELGLDGIERYGPEGLPNEVGGFTGEGRIGCRIVRCMSAPFQMRSHTGYGLDDGDRHDVFHLQRRFGLAIPVAYER